jgi:sarcosine oxidase subunit gamma
MTHGNSWLRVPTQRRFGIKGPRAAALLEQFGIPIPSRPNSWSPLRGAEHGDEENVIGRLGVTEFFLEEAGEAPAITALEKVVRDVPSGAYPVLREDFALRLGGVGANDVLARVCNVNFASLAPYTVVMTLMIGVAVLVMPQSTGDGVVYRIWCDPSFGSYLRSELEQMVSP